MAEAEPDPLSTDMLRALLSVVRLAEASARVGGGLRADLMNDALRKIRAVYRTTNLGGVIRQCPPNDWDAVMARDVAAEAFGAASKFLTAGDSSGFEMLHARLIGAIDALASVIEVRESIQALSPEVREKIRQGPPLGVRRKEMIEFLEHLGETVGPREKVFDRLESSGRIEFEKEGRQCWRVRFTDPDTHRIFTEWHRLTVAGRARESKGGQGRENLM